MFALYPENTLHFEEQNKVCILNDVCYTYAQMYLTMILMVVLLNKPTWSVSWCGLSTYCPNK
jgi:hypothetical protein